MLYTYLKLNRGVDVQEKLTNCGTKAADVLDKFLASKHNANPLNILVHLQLLGIRYNPYQFKVLLHLLPYCLAVI